MLQTVESPQGALTVYLRTDPKKSTSHFHTVRIHSPDLANFAVLEKEILSLPEDQRESFAAAQVKEKYGSLRFYMDCGTEKMWKLIEDAETKSESICEVLHQRQQSVQSIGVSSHK
jgi:hypothetical protein